MAGQGSQGRAHGASVREKFERKMQTVQKGLLDPVQNTGSNQWTPAGLGGPGSGHGLVPAIFLSPTCTRQVGVSS